VNYKNIDTNGDAQIDANDTLSIVKNWSRVINPTRHNPFHAPLGNPTGSPYPPFTLHPDTLSPGQTALLPLSFGSAEMPADSVYGLAFSISYDPKKVQPGIKFKPSASWFGDPAELLWLQRDFRRQGRLDVAITRTDGKPVGGWGNIGDVFVIIEDDIFFTANHPETESSSLDTIVKTKLIFSGLHQMGPAAVSRPFEASPAELVIIKSTTSVHESGAWRHTISVSPNPATETLRIACPDAVLQRVEITGMMGAVILTQESDNAHFSDITVRELAAGAYYARIFTDQGITVRKLGVTR
jgi:hypothetical protein